ncbi:ABC transporter substrate-binding protein [Raineyella sp. W15-4]|uniref:ABC transporter substrate-binding protein n=1 Tax=Raineyella sp. W15-4 TaxID=3081651 RepID=UPI002953CBE3|nr:ABC transporter substrate-binding protein [Raineyella sp. W15-4]WOQ18778.1 ABC transporter substrate-binding protein [Raineyella sp. W15-4]
MTRRRLGAALALAVVVTVAGCTQQTAPPAPQVGQPVPHESPSPTPTPRPDRDFTVGTTDAITSTDPVAMTTGGSETIAFSVFQRLMTTPAGQDLLKPDAARDCIFQQATVYTCTLLDGLRFQSGRPVTSADVKYSIERAQRLGVAGSGAAQLASISSIETPDPQTVRFVLSYADTDIGYALATPAASIVDPDVYPTDKVVDAGTRPVGSGPYRVTASGGGTWSFGRYEGYQGYAPASIVRVVLREYDSSAALEQAMMSGDVDATWRGLSAAAVIRQRADATADSSAATTTPVTGLTPVTIAGSRVLRLAWNTGSRYAGDAAVRAFVSQAAGDRRTLTSLLPIGVTGARTGLFPAGGTPALDKPSGTPLALTLGYDPRMPDGADLAAELARSLDATGLATVTVVPNAAGSDTGSADLQLLDERASTWTARAWLQRPLSVTGSPHEQEIQTILTRGLPSSDQATHKAAVSQLQYFAAEDAYVTPLSQTDEVVFVREGWSVDTGRMGPGWQLDLAAFSKNS